VKKVLLEGVLVAFVGGLLAFLANALSPHGLSLTTNFFPAETTRPAGPAPAPPVAGTNAPSPWEALAAKLREKGLQLADSNQVLQLFHDPRYTQGQVIFIDARSDKDYQAGHIPGAWQFDRYHPENYLASVAPACQNATQIIVYCAGGDCEDSEFAAINLRDVLGLPKEKLSVYGGGFTEWASNRLPIETGARNSGQMRDAVK
jgi:rhodanese-related sulfurtransferase